MPGFVICTGTEAATKSSFLRRACTSGGTISTSLQRITTNCKHVPATSASSNRKDCSKHVMGHACEGIFCLDHRALSPTVRLDCLLLPRDSLECPPPNPRVSLVCPGAPKPRDSLAQKPGSQRLPAVPNPGAKLGMFDVRSKINKAFGFRGL